MECLSHSPTRAEYGTRPCLKWKSYTSIGLSKKHWSFFFFFGQIRDWLWPSFFQCNTTGTAWEEGMASWNRKHTLHFFFFFFNWACGFLVKKNDPVSSSHLLLLHESKFELSFVNVQSQPAYAEVEAKILSSFRTFFSRRLPQASEVDPDDSSECNGKGTAALSLGIFLFFKSPLGFYLNQGSMFIE